MLRASEPATCPVAPWCHPGGCMLQVYSVLCTLSRLLKLMPSANTRSGSSPGHLSPMFRWRGPNVAAAQPPAPWILGLHALARLPQLDPVATFLPDTQHRMYPFPDTRTIVVRRAYRKLYELLIERKKSGITGGMVVGSPGIGLKALLCYLIKRYADHRRRIVFSCSLGSDRVLLLITQLGVMVLDEASAVKELQANAGSPSPAIFLVYGGSGLSSLRIAPAYSLLVATYEEGHEAAFSKQVAHLVTSRKPASGVHTLVRSVACCATLMPGVDLLPKWIPGWDLEELLLLGIRYTPTLTREEVCLCSFYNLHCRQDKPIIGLRRTNDPCLLIVQRFDENGGKPGDVFAEALFDPDSGNVRLAIESVDLRQLSSPADGSSVMWSGLRERLLIRQDINWFTGSFQDPDTGTRLASDSIAEELYRRLQAHAQWDKGRAFDILLSEPMPGLRSVLGIIFEAYMHATLRHGGAYKCRRLLSASQLKTGSGTAAESDLRLSDTMVVRFSDNADFGRLFAPGLYMQPAAKNYPSVGAAYVGPDARHPLLLQCTVAGQHLISDRIIKLLEQLPSGCEPQFMFVVPKVLFPRWSKQQAFVAGPNSCRNSMSPETRVMWDQMEQWVMMLP